MKTFFRIGVIIGVILLALITIVLHVFFPADQIEKDPNFPEIAGQYLGQEPPSSIAERYASGIIHNDLHTAVAFSPDGKEVYWSPMEGTIDDVNDILFMKLEEGQWTQPQVVSFSSRFSDSDNPCFSPDGKKLYFTSWRPIKWYQPFDSKERIWYVERTEKGWSEAKPVGAAINSMKLHWQLSVSESGTLYFASEEDIYYSEYDSGQYQEPKKLGSGVNTPSDEGHPYIAPDESYLIYSSNKQAKRRWDYDLFVSIRKSDGSWSEAVNLGEGVNSPYQDIYPIVTPDERYLFFLSNRGGSHSVYWVDFASIEKIILEQAEGS